MTRIPTLAELVQLEQTRSVAQVAAGEATARRNEAIIALLDSGIRQADIARALGISGGRVSQIVLQARQRLAA